MYSATSRSFVLDGSWLLSRMSVTCTEGRPNIASYGVTLMVEWYELLYAEIASGRNRSQSSPPSFTYLAKFGLIVLFGRSVIPLPSGW